MDWGQSYDDWIVMKMRTHESTFVETLGPCEIVKYLAGTTYSQNPAIHDVFMLNPTVMWHCHVLRLGGPRDNSQITELSVLSLPKQLHVLRVPKQVPLSFCFHIVPLFWKLYQSRPPCHMTDCIVLQVGRFLESERNEDPNHHVMFHFCVDVTGIGTSKSYARIVMSWKLTRNDTEFKVVGKMILSIIEPRPTESLFSQPHLVTWLNCLDS